MAVLELDYMEYANDAAAQAAYVTSDFGDGGTVFPDDGDTGHNITAGGNVQVDTAEKKFGTASGLFDGTGDYLSAPDHADWDFGTGDYTVDGWFYLTDDTANRALCGRYDDESKDSWVLRYRTTDNKLQIYAFNSVGVRSTISATNVFTLNTWHHVALVQYSDTLVVYVDGVVEITIDPMAQNIDNDIPFYVGAFNAAITSPWIGWIDEFRVSKGIARWTEDFSGSLPSSEYSSDGDTKLLLHCNGIPPLQSYSESTIKQQGSYSLKAIALITDSLNDTLTKSGLSIDLSDRTTLKLYVRADRAGTNIQARLYDSVGGWITKDVNVTSTGTFIEIDVDISGVSNANKSDITKIEFKILNADNDTIYYIDNFYAPKVVVGNAILFGINF